MQQWTDYIKPELLILVPVLYIVGVFLKGSKKVDDRNIPLYLGVVGIVLAAVFVSTTVDGTLSGWIQGLFASVTQGVLLAGMAVYSNQIIKQSSKEQ